MAIHTYIYRVYRLAVDDGAVAPDLPLGAGLDAHHAQPHHGPREHLEEHLGGPFGHALDVGPCRGVRDQGRVRLEQAPALEEAPVVAQVEGQEASRVHLHDRRVVRRRRALCAAEGRGVGGVQRRVRVAGAAAAREVVEPLAEGVAVRDADRVRAW